MKKLIGSELMNFNIEIPTDSEGFYSLECPHCRERYKVSSIDIDAEDTIELFCPSCGLSGEKSDFISKDIIEHAETLALNYATQEIFNAFKKTNNKRRGFGISFDMKKPMQQQPKLLKEDEKLEKIELYCCDKVIKINIDHKVSNVYCPFCGVN